MASSIPPRTMGTVFRELTRRGSGSRSAGRPAPRLRTLESSALREPPVAARVWRYQTRPSFKSVRGPLVDVFNEAEEVLIVIDLGGFARGEISVGISPHQYTLLAARGDQRFQEVIDLPPNVDTVRASERLTNGVLEIVLPRKTESQAARETAAVEETEAIHGDRDADRPEAPDDPAGRRTS